MRRPGNCLLLGAGVLATYREKLHGQMESLDTWEQITSNSHYGNGMTTVNHFMLSQLSKLARLEAEMSRNIDFYALLVPEMAGITFVVFDQQP